MTIAKRSLLALGLAIACLCAFPQIAVAGTATIKVHITCSGNRGDAQIAMRWGHRDFHENEYFPTWKTHCPGVAEKLFQITDQNSEFEIQTEGGNSTGYEVLAYINPGDVMPSLPSIELRHNGSSTSAPVTRNVVLTRSSGPNQYGEQNFRVDLASVPCAMPKVLSSSVDGVSGSRDSFVVKTQIAIPQACNLSAMTQVFPKSGNPILATLRVSPDGTSSTSYGGYPLPAQVKLEFQCDACAFPRPVYSPTYAVNGPPLLAIESLNSSGAGRSASAPDTLYVPVGTKVQLAWNVSNCTTNCSVVLQSFGGLNYGQKQFERGNLAASAGTSVTPSETMTKYTLKATSVNGSDTKSVIVQLSPQATTCSTCAWFWFKVVEPSSSARACYTTAIWAKDEASAKAIAQSQAINYTVSSISYQEYVDGCN